MCRMDQDTVNPDMTAGISETLEQADVDDSDAEVDLQKDLPGQIDPKTATVPFESMISAQQALTFSAADKVFRDEKIKFKNKKKKALGLLTGNGQYTNLALLLSDQCPFSITVALFNGTDKAVLLEKHTFSGSLLEQVPAVLAYLETVTQMAASADDKPLETTAFPVAAIREALLNAVVHRDYYFADNTLINLYADRLEMVTLGGLPSGLSPADLQLGVSVWRNRQLAGAFCRLRIIEGCGTGLSRIMSSYQGFDPLPKLETSDHAFMLTLPKQTRPESGQNSLTPGLSHDEQLVLTYLAEKKQAMRKEIESKFTFSQAKTIRLLNRLIEMDLIAKSGQGKSTLYAAK